MATGKGKRVSEGDSSAGSRPPAGSDALQFQLAPDRVFRWLTLLVVALAAGHIGGYLVRSIFGLTTKQTFGLFGFFNFGMEANLPTYVSALNLLVAGLLLMLIAIEESRRRGVADWPWWGLAAGMTLMSVDEAAKFHEGVVGKLMYALVGRGEGIFYYSWYAFYGPLVGLLAIVYLPFLLRLPRRTALRFLLAGAVFLAGALGMEMFEASLRSERAAADRMGWLYLVEEGLELMGIVLFIRALLIHLADLGSSLQVAFGAERRGS